LNSVDTMNTTNVNMEIKEVTNSGEISGD
jgi:hypothetical protein